MSEMIHSTDETDVGVVSLDDRRKIRSLENQVEDLTRKLSEAIGRAKPQLERKLDDETCLHSGGFLVSDHLLEVVCKVCGALCEPYAVLRKIAHREINFCYTLNALRDEKAALAKDVERLKGQRARLRGQVSKATPETPLEDIAAAMERVGADRLEIVSVGGVRARASGGDWGAWFFASRMNIAVGPASRSIREAVARLIEVADEKQKADAK